MNNVFGEPWIIRHTNYFSDPAAGPDELLNDATEWLHYAYNTIKLLAELAHERGSVDAHRLPIMRRCTTTPWAGANRAPSTA